MKIEKQIVSDSELILKLNGEMDAYNCANARKDFEELATSSVHNITIDMSHINFLDSSGVGVIVFLFKRLREQNRTLKLVGANGQPQELMTLLRIDSAIPVESFHQVAS